MIMYNKYTDENFYVIIGWVSVCIVGGTNAMYIKYWRGIYEALSSKGVILK